MVLSKKYMPGSDDYSIKRFSKVEEINAWKFTNLLNSPLELTEEWYVSFRAISLKKPLHGEKINIHLTEVDKVLQSGIESSLLHSTPLPRINTDYIFIEAEKSEYYSIKASRLNQLSIFLTDEENQSIDIADTGQPTIIVLKFKKIGMSHHIVHLNSYDSKDIFAKNSISEFTNKLIYPLALSD